MWYALHKMKDRLGLNGCHTAQDTAVEDTPQPKISLERQPGQAVLCHRYTRIIFSGPLRYMAERRLLYLKR